MGVLVLEPTLKSPLFEFNSKGIFIIEGRAISENVEETFKPAIDWCNKVTAEDVSLLVKLDCVNVASSKQMIIMLKTLRSNKNIKDVTVCWYFDDEDLAMYDMGKMFSELVPEFKFKFLIVWIKERYK